MAEEQPFEKNTTGNQEFPMTHGELNPTPQQAPVNENPKPSVAANSETQVNPDTQSGNQASPQTDGSKVESNVTATDISQKQAATPYTVPHPADAGVLEYGRSMAVVAPRK